MAGLLVLSAAMALVAGACGGGGGEGTGAGVRPSSTARLGIVEPANGSTLPGPTVPVRISIQDAQLTDQISTDLSPGLGHLHVSLDGTLVGMNYQLQGEIPNVAPGTHVLRVEFVAVDHAPFNPRVFAEITFEVVP